MNQILEFINRFDRRHLLFGAVAVLLVMNLGQWSMDYFEARQGGLADRIGQLGQYRKAVQRLPELEDRVALLGRQQQQIESFLFMGETEDKIVSAMQIMLQSEIAGSGLEAESIQPMRSEKPGEGGKNGEIAIKVLMSGSLNDFGKFLHSRYGSKQFFRVENLSLKQLKPGELKIAMDLRGYYKIGKEAVKNP